MIFELNTVYYHLEYVINQQQKNALTSLHPSWPRTSQRTTVRFKMATEKDGPPHHSAPTDTPSLQLHVEQRPLKKTWRLWVQKLLGEGRKAHIKAGRRSWDTTSPYTLAPAPRPSQKGTRKPELLPEERRLWAPPHAPPTFRTCTWEISPRNT